MTKEEFWPLLRAGELDECWPWPGVRTDRGYGRVWATHNGKRGMHRAHRLAFELHYGEAPGSLSVRHKCDNPPCCNPLHLELGTNLENVRDRVERGDHSNHVCGSKHPLAVLTEALVAEIRSQYAAGTLGPIRAAARRYGITRTPMTMIVRGVSWPHVEADAGRDSGR